MPEEFPYTPKEFAEVLADQDSPLIVGGQAVNIWAELYVRDVPALEALEPFTSKDADIYGTRALAESLAKRTGWSCKVIDDKNSVLVAILHQDYRGRPAALTIEVLGEVNGLDSTDLNLNAVIELKNGERYRLPTPVVLLKAKLYNLNSLVGIERPQDIRHARMLMEILPSYLNEMLTEHHAGRLPEKDLVGAIQYLRTFIHSGWVQNVINSRRLNFLRLIPSSIFINGPSSVREAAHQYIKGLTLPEGPLFGDRDENVREPSRSENANRETLKKYMQRFAATGIGNAN